MTQTRFITVAIPTRAIAITNDRIKWEELRQYFDDAKYIGEERFLVIADFVGGFWQFYERSTMDMATIWYPIETEHLKRCGQYVQDVGTQTIKANH